MRKLMWFTIGFAAACAVGIYLVSGSWLLLLALFCVAALIPCVLIKTNWFQVAKVALVGCAIGFVWLWLFDAFYVSNARSVDGQTLQTSIQVTDYSYKTDYGTAVDGTIRIDKKNYKVRVYLSDTKTVSPGDGLDGTFRLRFTADGGESEPTYHPGKGIFLLAYEEANVNRIEAGEVPAKYFAAVLRRNIKNTIDKVFPEDTRAFGRALLLGDSSLLSYKTDTAFKISGIRHVIAVSGLHVSILFSFVYTVTGRRRWMTAMLGLPILLLFAAVAGFTPSVVRACLMQALMILALLVNAEYDPPTALSFAVLAMLVCNPQAITSVSLQLSVGCMVGIFLFSEKISNYILHERRLGPAKGKSLRAKLCRWMAGSVSVTLSAMAVTTPLCAWYFGMVSLIGILANLLTLWLISYIFYGIMVACVLSVVSLPLAQAVAWIVSWLVRGVIWVSKVLSAIPLAAIYTSSVYTVAWLVCAYILLAVFLACKRKNPGIFAGSVTLMLCICVLFSWLEPRLDDYRVSVLDVGQGQCVLLQSEGKTYMVDCGGDDAESAADVAIHHLLSQGIFRLDGLIITHYDTDHAAGAELVLKRIPANVLYLPQAEDEKGIKDRLAGLYADKIQWLPEDTVITPEENLLTLISGQKGDSGNNGSICVLFQPENCDILITGDRSVSAERSLLKQTNIPDLEVLVAGHHGSKNSTGFELLHATKPEIVAISVGSGNIYGHPAWETLERLAIFRCKVWRTDLNGTLIFRG